MTDEQILAALQQAAREETGEAGVVLTPGMVAAEVPGWDSLTHTRIMLAVEERLGIELDIRQTYEAADMGALVAVLRRMAGFTPG